MRSEQELKDNLAAYWRRMNAACGLPAGTHPDDPNPSQPEAATPHRLSSRAEAVTPMHGNAHLHAMLLCDPEVLGILQDHWHDVFVPNDLGPAPIDHIQQLRWYTLRDLNDFHHRRHQADFEDARKFRTRRRVDKLLGKLAQHDPLFEGTIQVLDHCLGSLPRGARDSVQEVFARCPLETLELYKEMRGTAQRVMRMNSHRRKRAGR